MKVARRHCALRARDMRVCAIKSERVAEAVTPNNSTAKLMEFDSTVENRQLCSMHEQPQSVLTFYSGS